MLKPLCLRIILFLFEGRGMKNKTKRIKKKFRAIKYVFISAFAGIIRIGGLTLLNEIFHSDYRVSYLSDVLTRNEYIII